MQFGFMANLENIFLCQSSVHLPFMAMANGAHSLGSPSVVEGNYYSQ
jgi:hypothetical protein